MAIFGLNLAKQMKVSRKLEQKSQNGTLPLYLTWEKFKMFCQEEKKTRSKTHI